MRADKTSDRHCSVLVVAAKLKAARLIAATVERVETPVKLFLIGEHRDFGVETQTGYIRRRTLRNAIAFQEGRQHLPCPVEF